MKPITKKPSARPSKDELPDETLDKVAGGVQPPVQGGDPTDANLRETPKED